MELVVLRFIILINVINTRTFPVSANKLTADRTTVSDVETSEEPVCEVDKLNRRGVIHPFLSLIFFLIDRSGGKYVNDCVRILTIRWFYGLPPANKSRCHSSADNQV